MLALAKFANVVPLAASQNEAIHHGSWEGTTGQSEVGLHLTTALVLHVVLVLLVSMPCPGRLPHSHAGYPPRPACHCHCHCLCASVCFCEHSVPDVH